MGEIAGNGERLGITPINPPVTALLFAAVLRFFPHGYVALNTLTPLLLFAALGFAAGPIMRRVGRNAGLLVLLLTLASTRFHDASTRLLSEPAYLAFSMAALFLLDSKVAPDSPPPTAPPPGQWWTWIAGLLMVTAMMSRIIGVTLPLAILTVQGLAWWRFGRSPNRLLTGLALVSLGIIVGWEIYTGQGYAAGWLRMIEGSNPWIPDAPRASTGELLARVVRNLPGLSDGGSWLLNSWSSDSPPADLLLRSIATATFTVGLFLAGRRRMGIVEMYVALYLVVVLVNRLAGEDPNYRFFLPILPLLICYSVLAVQTALGRIGARRDLMHRLLLGAAAAGVLLYLKASWPESVRGVVAAHYSPFGDYPIKRPQNVDAQRLALWLRDHSAPEERYASAQRDMFDVITERRGYDLVPGQFTPRGAFLSWLEQRRVRYLLVDHTSPLGDSLLVVVREYPALFTRIGHLSNASLYRLQSP